MDYCAVVRDSTTYGVQDAKHPVDSAFSRIAAQFNHLITMTPEQRIYVAEAELAIAKALKEEADKVAALKAQFDNDRDLAQATIDLIFSARVLRTGIVAPTSVREESLARFRKELAPLAESYGVKIVLTGDKTTATVVLS